LEKWNNGTLGMIKYKGKIEKRKDGIMQKQKTDFRRQRTE
jgi:hypothetical protein